jgi:hypothetical protein
VSSINSKLHGAGVLYARCHVRAEKRLINSESVSAFYRHVNRKLDNCQRIPPIRAANGAVLTHDGDKVEAFNKFFTSVFSHSDPHLRRVQSTLIVCQHLSTFLSMQSSCLSSRRSVLDHLDLMAFRHYFGLTCQVY